MDVGSPGHHGSDCQRDFAGAAKKSSAGDGSKNGSRFDLTFESSFTAIRFSAHLPFDTLGRSEGESMSKQEKHFQETKASQGERSEKELEQKNESLRTHDTEMARRKNFKDHPHTKEKFGSMTREHSEIKNKV
jgi:hypothetical protein